MSEWISVKDRLPEIAEGRSNTDLLIAVYICDGESVVDAAYLERPYSEASFWLSGTSKDLIYNVSHWQPLPAPPEVPHDTH